MGKNIKPPMRMKRMNLSNILIMIRNENKTMIRHTGTNRNTRTDQHRLNNSEELSQNKLLFQSVLRNMVIWILIWNE